MDALLENLRAQLDEARNGITALTQRAADENRDLNDAEQHNFDAYRTQIEGLQPRIDQLAAVQRSYDASASAIASVVDGNGNSGVATLQRAEAPDYLQRTYPTAGAWVVDYLMSRAPGGIDVSSEQRAAARDRIQRAVANQTTADNPGLIPEPIIGPVINFIDNRRPVWNTFTQRPITAGPLFYRPRVTQHTLVGPQTAEKTELPSRKMLVERVPVTVATYGGVVDISLQDIQWSNPSIMQAIIDDLRAQYVLQTEGVAAGLLNTTGDANTITADSADAQGLIKALYDASAAVFTGIGLLPTHVAMSVDVWARIGSLTDAGGRPIFPSMGPANAPGMMNATSLNGSVVGLIPVVSSGLPADTLIVYRADALEGWEQLIGVLQVTEPRLLGTEVAYAGFAASLALSADAAVSITLPAGP